MVVLHLLVFIVKCHTDQGCHGHDPMVVGFTTTYASCEFKSRSWRSVFHTTLCDKVC
jgi:hypothetical protein